MLLETSHEVTVIHPPWLEPGLADILCSFVTASFKFTIKILRGGALTPGVSAPSPPSLWSPSWRISGDGHHYQEILQHYLLYVVMEWFCVPAKGQNMLNVYLPCLVTGQHSVRCSSSSPPPTTSSSTAGWLTTRWTSARDGSRMDIRMNIHMCLHMNVTRPGVIFLKTQHC